MPIRSASRSRVFRLMLLLSLSSGLSVVLVVARILYLHQTSFIFLVWNLFLAWIPLLAALLFWGWSLRPAGRMRRTSLPLVEALLLGVWLLFFPNAPYMVTDFLHLMPRAGAPLWYDLMLFFSFAWNGLLLGFVSLWIVQTMAERRWGAAWSWRLASLTLVAAAFGVYVGRFLRWNSWDLLTNPALLARDLLPHLINPMDHPGTVGLTALLSTFLLLAYATLRHLAHVPWGGLPGESPESAPGEAKPWNSPAARE